MSESASLSDEAIEQLKAKYPDDELFAQPTALGPVVYKAANGAQLDRWSNSKLENRKAAEQLALDVCVYPDRATLTGYFQKKALLGPSIAMKAREKALGLIEEDEKKL